MNQNDTHKQINSRLNSGNACHYSMAAFVFCKISTTQTLLPV